MFEVIKQWFIKHMPVQEDIGLHENKAFLRWITYPLLVILAIAFAITWNLFETGVYSFDKEFEISFITLNDFAKYYAFPIASLTVPLTFGVMFNRFHSSKQKAKSNLLVEQNNSANSFFNHYKYFAEFCEKVQDRYVNRGLKIKPEVCYKSLFRESSVENFTTSVDIDFIKSYFRSLSYEVIRYRDIVKNEGYKDLGGLNFENERFIKGDYIFNLSCAGISLTYPTNNDKTLHLVVNESIDILITILNFNGVSGTTNLVDLTTNLQNNLIEQHFNVGEDLSIKFDEPIKLNMQDLINTQK